MEDIPGFRNATLGIGKIYGVSKKLIYSGGVFPHG